MSGALLYESPKESEAEEVTEVNVRESEAGGSEFEPSEAEESEEMWVY